MSYIPVPPSPWVPTATHDVTKRLPDDTMAAIQADITDQVADSGSGLRAELDATFGSVYASAATKAATAPLMSGLKRGVGHRCRLTVSDSTGNEQIEHVYLEGADLVARFPAVTGVYSLFDDATGAYPSGTVTQVGSGTRTLSVGTTAASSTLTSAGGFTSADVGQAVIGPGIAMGAVIKTFTDANTVVVSIPSTATGTVTARIAPFVFWDFNCSVPGKTPQYVLGARWNAAVAAVPSPDLICIIHGHNTFDPTPNTNGYVNQHGYFLSLTEEIAIQHPKAGILLESQNPTFTPGRETWQAQKAQVLQAICAQRGYGFIDVHQAFIDTGNPAAYVKSDLIHPTTSADAPAPNGSRLWADVVGQALVYSRDAASLPRQRSSLLDAAASLVPNVNFTDWSGTNPDGWTATNATLTKDTTTFETGTYSMRITAGGSTGAAMAELTSLTSWGNKALLAGRPVTLAARVFVPDTYTGTPSVVIKGTGGTAQQGRMDGQTDARGRWQWLIVGRTDTGDGGQLTVQLAARLSGSASGYILVDRIRVVEGDLPRDVVTGTPGPAGAAGTSAGQLDYIGTAGDNPALGMLLAAYGGVGVSTANNAHFFKIKPHRDISVSILEWQVHTTGGNYDIGIYSESGTRLWSKGSTVTPGAGAVIETVSPAVGMVAGTTYLLAIAFDGTTQLARGATLGSGNLLRFADATCSAFSLAASFPLPSTITPSTGQLNRWQMIAARSA